MKQETLHKILDVQDAAREDEIYRQLLAEYEPISQRFVRALQEMAPEHRAALEDFFGITAAMHLRLLEMAVEIDSL